MPQRFLRPALRNSERWNSVCEKAQGLYVRLLNVVDDYGRFDGRPAVILGECYSVWNAVNPECQHNVVTVTAMCKQLVSKKLISFYTYGGKTFLQFEQWFERSRVASKYPDPKPEMLSPCWHDVVTVSAPCAPSVPVPVPVPITSTIAPPKSASPPSEAVPEELPVRPPDPKPERKRFEKPTIEAVKLQAAKIGLPESEAIKFWNYYESKGWKVGKSPMVSWHSAMVNWRSNWQERGGQISSEQQPAASKAQRNADLLSQAT